MKRRTLQLKRISHCCHTISLPGYGRMSIERRHLFPRCVLRSRIILYTIVWRIQYITMHREMEEWTLQSRHLVKTARNSLKTHYFALAGQLATFFFHLYIIFNIFFAFKWREKVGKWPENPQTLGAQRFQPGHFWNKSGQKVGKWPVFHQFSVRTRLSNLQIFAKSEPKVGKWPVLQTKSGQQNDLLLTVIVAAFDHLGRDFQAVYGRILF